MPAPASAACATVGNPSAPTSLRIPVRSHPTGTSMPTATSAASGRAATMPASR